LRVAARTAELVPIGAVATLLPESQPLRKPIAIRMGFPVGESREHAALFRDHGDGWEFVSASYDSVSPAFIGDSRSLGRFGVFRDVRAPRIVALPAPRRAASRPYDQWGLEAKLTDDGSGIDPRASRFVIDGRPVPSEWDSEEGILRWRPLHRSRRGTHRF